MKKSFMTRALAAGLSLAMAFSLSAATNVTTAAAAAKPAMKHTTFTLKVDQSKNFQATAATQKAYKITKLKQSAAGKTKFSAKINSSKKSVKITGIKKTNGSNLVITFKNNKSKKLSKVTTRVVVKEVNTAPQITGVTQQTFTKFTATMSTALDKVDVANIAMERDDDKQTIPVKSARLDGDDKTKVVFEVYNSLTDAKTYTVTYTADDEAKTQSTAKVTVTNGVVANVGITPTQITFNKETLIEYQTLDANGVVISQQGVSNPEASVTVDCDTAQGFLDDSTSKLVLYNVGDTAKFTVTYHTMKFDANGQEQGVVSGEFTVTAGEDTTVISDFTYTIAKDKPFDWAAEVEAKGAQNRIAVDDTSKNAYFMIKDSEGNNVTETCEYTVESSNNSIIVADGDVASGVPLSPVAQGTAYLMVKDKNGVVKQTLPITVSSKRRLTQFTLDKSSVSIADVEDPDEPVVKGYVGVTAKDQYGDKIDVNLEIDENRSKVKVTNIENISDDDSDKNVSTLRIVDSKGDDFADVKDAKAGAGKTDSYVIKATQKTDDSVSLSATLTVRVVKTDEKNPTYSVVFVKDREVIDSIDAGKVVDDEVEVDACVVEKHNGVITNIAKDTIKVKDIIVKKGGSTFASANNKGITSKSAIYNANISDESLKKVITDDEASAKVALETVVTAVTDAAIDGKKVIDVSRSLSAGTYQYSYTLITKGGDTEDPSDDKTAKANGSLSVSNGFEGKVSANVLKTAFGNEGGGEVANVLNELDYVEYYWGSVNLKDIADYETYIDADVSSMGKDNLRLSGKNENGTSKNAFVRYAEVTVPLKAEKTDDVQRYARVVVTINKSFSSNNGWNPLPEN